MMHALPPRRAERVPIRASIALRRSFAQRAPGRLVDLSAHGCRVEWTEWTRAGERLFVSLPTIAPIEAEARWISGRTVGVEFARPLHPAVFAMLARRMGR
jgi:hypothetical protein